MMLKIYNPTLFCTDSGYSGSLKSIDAIDDHLKQPFFMTIGLKVTSIIEYEELTNKYKKFKNDHGYKDEETIVLSLENKELLADFINTFIDDKNWWLSVVDKEWNICLDALGLLMPYWPNWIDEVAEILYKNEYQKNYIINCYKELLRNQNLEQYYNKIIDTIDYEQLKSEISFENLKENYHNFIKSEINSSSITKLISIYYLTSTFVYWPEFTLFEPIYYEDNQELKDCINPSVDSDIHFCNSKNESLIQLANNYLTVFQQYFSSTFLRKDDESFHALFNKLDINYSGRIWILSFNKIATKFIKTYWPEFIPSFNNF